jgi:mevalonate kinase
MSNTRVSDFSIEVPAKWVLAGEHSVLRGKRAIAFPHPEFTLKLFFREQASLTITANPFQAQIRILIGRACEYLGKDPKAFSSGEIDIQSSIPIGAGLGSSAALSVAMARLVIWKTASSLEHWIPLATHLEDVFHGKSSGMDVSVIAHSQPILFSIEKRSEVLGDFERLPRFEFYDSGKRGQTKICIEKVLDYKKTHPEKGDALDDQMGAATEKALTALLAFDQNQKESELALAQAMNSAHECYETWGLVPTELLEQRQELLKQGALAVRLTGAGLGGFWVALWPSAARGRLDNPR